MLRVKNLALLLLLFVPFSAGATESSACGSPPSAHVCLGKIDAPAHQLPLIAQAGRQAVDVLVSERLAEEVETFRAAHGASGAHAAAWRGFETRSALAEMRRHVGGISITTYGGLINWLKFRFAGNLAFEPKGADGPIRLNRAGLRDRSSASIANTIIHELAHKAGLTHPSSERRATFATALCEPPYLIGSLAERILEGESWESEGHCSILTK